MAAGLGEVDQSVSRRVHVVVAFLRLHEKSVSVLIPVFPWLDLKVRGGGGGGLGGAGGEGEGEHHAYKKECFFHNISCHGYRGELAGMQAPLGVTYLGYTRVSLCGDKNRFN